MKNRVILCWGLAEVLILMGFLAVPAATRASSIPWLEPGTEFFGNTLFVLDDTDLFAQNMGVGNIQAVFDEYGSCLATYTSGGRSAAEIVYDAAVANGINPSVLLMTMQKEQSLLTSANCTEYAVNCAMGYGSAASTFVEQVDSAAWQFKRYYILPQNYNFRSGQAATTEDNYAVTPANAASAGQLNYTPHRGSAELGGGVYLARKIWMTLFEGALTPGMFVRESNDATVYQVTNDKILHPLSDRVIMQSYNAATAVVGPGKLSGYNKNASELLLNEGSLVRNPAGAVLVMENGALHEFPSKDMFSLMGYEVASIKDIARVSDEFVGKHPAGDPVTTAGKPLPSNTLVRQKGGNNGVYLLQNGSRLAFDSPHLFNLMKKGRTVLELTREQLEEYSWGGHVSYPVGSLLRNAEGAVYLVDELGVLRGFTSAEELRAYGYTSKSITQENDTRYYDGRIQAVGESL